MEQSWWKMSNVLEVTFSPVRRRPGARTLSRVTPVKWDKTSADPGVRGDLHTVLQHSGVNVTWFAEQNLLGPH